VQPVPLGLAQRRRELGRARRQQRHGLLHIPPRGRRRHPEPRSEFGECLTFTQVGQDEQGLLPGVRPPPDRPFGLPVAPDHPGDVVQGLILTRPYASGSPTARAPVIAATILVDSPASNHSAARSRTRSRRSCSARVYPPLCPYRTPRSYRTGRYPSRPKDSTHSTGVALPAIPCATRQRLRAR